DELLGIFGRLDKVIQCVAIDLCTIGGPSAIGLAPERAVSGISIKVTTYLNLGMSVLTTPDVLEAYGHALDDLVETAEDTKQFVDRAIALLDDRDARLKRAEQVRGMLHYRLNTGDLVQYLSDVRTAKLKNRPAKVSGTLG
ncbi:MAG: hypothetical protein AAFV38_11565, partial [Pseudomonadota bacterium]